MKRKIAVTSAAAAGAIALGLGLPALAQDGEESPGPRDGDRDARVERFIEHRSGAEREFAERLAEELGLDADTVAEAIEKVRTEWQEERRVAMLEQLQRRLDEAVENGRITQEEADLLRQLAERRADRGGPGGLLRHHWFGHHGLGHHGFGWHGFGWHGFDRDLPRDQAPDSGQDSAPDGDQSPSALL